MTSRRRREWCEAWEGVAGRGGESGGLWTEPVDVTEERDTTEPLSSSHSPRPTGELQSCQLGRKNSLRAVSTRGLGRLQRAARVHVPCTKKLCAAGVSATTTLESHAWLPRTCPQFTESRFACVNTGVSPPPFLFLNQLDLILLVLLILAFLRPRVKRRSRMTSECVKYFGNRGWAMHFPALNNVSKLGGMFQHFCQMAHPRVHAHIENAKIVQKKRDLFQADITLAAFAVFQPKSKTWPCVETSHLVHTVQELQEDGREAAALAAGAQVAALAELVAKGKPLFLQQHLETLQSAVEGITEQLHQGHHLQTCKREPEGDQ